MYLDGKLRDPADIVDRQTITVESPDESYSQYELAVESDLQKSDAYGASRNADDTVSGTDAAGAVSGGRDSYTYTGSLERFAAEDVRLFIDGQVRDANNLVESHTITLRPILGGEFPIDYALSVDADLRQDDALGATIDEGDIVYGNSADGTVTSGRDSYTYAGNMTLEFDGVGLPVLLDGQARRETFDGV